MGFIRTIIKFPRVPKMLIIILGSLQLTHGAKASHDRELILTDGDFGWHNINMKSRSLGKSIGITNFQVHHYPSSKSTLEIYGLFNHTSFREKFPEHKATGVGTHLLCAAILVAEKLARRRGNTLQHVELEAMHGIRDGKVSILQSGPLPFYLKFGFDINKARYRKKVPVLKAESKNALYDMLLPREYIEKVLANYSLKGSEFKGIHEGRIYPQRPIPKSVLNCDMADSSEFEHQTQNFMGCSHCIPYQPFPKKGSVWEKAPRKFTADFRDPKGLLK